MNPVQWQIDTIFAEPQLPDRPARVIAREIGGRVERVAPCETILADDPEATYLERQRRKPTPSEDIQWKGSFLSLAWSPGGRFLCGGTQEGTMQFFRLPAKQHEPLQMSGYPAKIRNLAWDTTGRWLASDGGPVVIVWDVSGKGPANTTPRQLEGHPGRVSALAWQSRGSLLASGCEKGLLFLWEPVRQESHLRVHRLPSAVTVLRWSPDHRHLAVGTRDGTVAICPDLGRTDV